MTRHVKSKWRFCNPRLSLLIQQWFVGSYLFFIAPPMLAAKACSTKYIKKAYLNALR